MKILALNCGSSSAKYQLYDWEKKQVLCKGLVEKVVVGEGKAAYINHKPSGKESVTIEKACPTHKEALQLIFDTLVHPQHGIIKDVKELDAIGHRVVHGGMQFARSFLINQELIDKLQENIPLAPLHNPANIQGIQAVKELMPSLPQIAVLTLLFIKLWNLTLIFIRFRWICIPHIKSDATAFTALRINMSAGKQRSI